MAIVMLAISLFIGLVAIKWYFIDKVHTKRLIISMLIVTTISGYTFYMDGEVARLNREAASMEATIKELKSESVDKQDEIRCLEELLSKKFSNAAPPRGSDDIYYDIDLPKELQYYTYLCCEYFDLDYKLFLSLMYVESRYDVNASNGGGKYVGLVQISADNIDYIEEVLGVDIDVYNPYDNILAGTFWLSRYAAKYPDDLCMQLQCYNMGEAGAKNNRSNTSYYSSIISYYLNI